MRLDEETMHDGKTLLKIRSRLFELSGANRHEMAYLLVEGI